MRSEQEEEQEEGPLSRFAYASSAPPPRSRPPRAIPAARAEAPNEWPNTLLVRLSKCIVCRLQWTSSKSAKQKRAHMEQCAKKNAVAPDTVRFLIDKEISPNVDLNENASTLMDSVVPAATAKKPRRQRVVPTVRALPETRASILDRARDILGSANTCAAPHPTQQFSRSALARREPRHPERPALLDLNGCVEEPPLTQPFGASSLRGQITERPIDRREGSSGASMFAQDAILSSDCVRSFSNDDAPTSHFEQKRPGSPALVAGDPRVTRRRLR